MDNISIFVNHFVIHSESREALILNSSTVEYFETQLRKLILAETKDKILERVKLLHYDMKLAEPHMNHKMIHKKDVSPEYNRLRDASIALMDLYNDIAWEKE